MPRVKCDDCPCLIHLSTDIVSLCGLGYDSFQNKSDYVEYSDSCRLIKIVTKDGEIYPEPAEESHDNNK
jgi:hypothetical protein